ncbi:MULTISPECIES: hypothetical protein [unclassified Actinopolyspora]|uniref:hypothetical protein n=1 Tax=unclassified Actinopolyspora TaxID=2639451 RepID=UPI0013F66599|nr:MULTISPECIES: hypothetical protein [unclassified Actinopolyspora]NHD18556.1 hypothetical protein [Actinopolyspora sp. BKK2]NHE77485.1 hypothetical protein [Actinopolyspora sp. BKK1]
MTETLPTRWRDHELHWHAHLRTNTSTAKLRRNYSPETVLPTPQARAEWVAEQLTAHSATTIAIEWHTPWDVTLDGPGMRDTARDRHALAAGLPIDALIATATGELYLHVDPHTPEQCPHHKSQAASAV